MNSADMLYSSYDKPALIITNWIGFTERKKYQVYQ